MCSDERDAALIEAIEIAKSELLGNPDTPTSCCYVRKLVRPKVYWWRIVTWCIAISVGSVVLWRILEKVCVTREIATGICLAVVLTTVVLCLKQICICLVRIYQRYAPDSIRNKCRFEPSCSEYMILALEKYGLVKGLFKGIDRLKRCNIHNGGFDEP